VSTPLTFEVTASCRDSRARTGVVTTPHGSFETPVFMPVGTRAAMKGLTPRQVGDAGSTIILNNAYHLMLRPGDEMVARRGGVHRFMRWGGPILTDSGGYQAYSMADINELDEDGVVFKSIVDGSMVHLGPERSMEVQNHLGADIIMAFDDCPPSVDPATFNESRRRIAMARAGWLKRGYDHSRRLREAHERTLRWLDRCVAAHARPEEQALFGIIQGGTDLELRDASLEGVCNVDLPGYAIGGVAVGEGPELIASIVEHVAPKMPWDKPRYLMGVGYERDLVAAVRAGVDMFDCVLPTRNGRNANVFTRTGTFNLRNARFTEDDRPIEEGCDCEACGGGFSRAYLRHLFKAGEMLGPTLASIHNVRHFHLLMLDIRRAIRDDLWPSLRSDWPVLSESLPASPETPAGGAGG